MEVTQSMKGKVAIITGASSGIGRASVMKFAKEGCDVVAVARSAGRLEEVVRETEAATGPSTPSGRIRPVVADVTVTSDLDRVIREAVTTFGGIDVLVNAAGILKSGTIETTSLDDWDRLMDINVRAPFVLIQKVMPFLIERKGNVVNVSSVNGIRAFPGVLGYCVSKAALDQLTHCVALETAAKGVRINAVNPGVTVTGLHKNSGMDDEAYAAFLERSKATHPLGRVGRPEEVAELIFFLASPNAGWITGGSYSIDGGRGQTCLR